MEKLARVKRSAFSKLGQEKFSLFAQNVIAKTNADPIFAPMESTLTVLKEKSKAFDALLVAAKKGGKILTYEKQVAFDELKIAMEKTANALDYFSEGDADFIIKSGNEIQGTPTRATPNNEVPEMPIDVVVSPTLEMGVVHVSYNLEKRSHILNVGVEWTPDNGVTWNNGTYFSGKSGKLKNLPSFSIVKVRFRSIGRNDLKSPWTMPIEVRVF